jgi:putative ABC transport system ATP-binding protein
MLRVENVSKSYPGPPPRVVLRGVSLTLEAGEQVAIMGESGSGKSTLLNLIAGLDAADAGRIIVNGVDVRALDDDARTRLRRATMGFVFQAFHLLPHLSVAKNVALPLALNGVHDGVNERVEELLAAVGMSERKDAAPRELAHRPRLVLADEPTGNLDAESAAEVLQLLRAQLRRDGAAGVLVTHSALAAASSDRVLRLSSDGLMAVSETT